MKTKKIDGNSYFPQGNFLNQLKSDFPEVFTEDSKIDIDKLKVTLGENADLGEKYGLSWKGKNEVFRTIQETTTKTLKPAKNESVDFDTSDNIFIEGDNLEALKILQRAYYGKIKMVYIDPPYNTGNDFVYNDKFSQNREEYEMESGIRDENGKIKEISALYKNTREAGHFHSNWLNMMYPRLYLARNLLKQDGVIFISIDDNEVYNLRMIMNEIFGEENFIGIITVVGNPRGRDYGGIARMHDYILVYSKSEEMEISDLYDPDKVFPFEDKQSGFEIRELRNRNIAFNKENRPNLYYPFYVNPNNSDKNGLLEISMEKKQDWVEVYPKESQGFDTVWRWGKERSSKYLNTEIKGKEMEDGGYQIVEKYRKKTRMARSVWNDKDVNTEKGTLLVKELFGRKVFSFPKPIEMIMRVIEMGSNEDSIILDFFAGSGTLAHSVMQFNSKNGGNRKWICVQLPEETQEESEARKAGYKNIADIAKERIRRAAKKIKEGNNGQLPLQDLKQDLGFKVFKVDKTNFKVWDSGVEDAEKLEKQMLEMFDTVRVDAKEEDLLFELMIKSGIAPTVRRMRKSEKSQDYWKIGDGELIICLEDKITTELFNAMLSEKPQKIILLDKSFPNDQLKKNLTLQAEKENIEVLVV